MRNIPFLVVLLFISVAGYSQTLSGLRSVDLRFKGDSISLDTLSIAPGSERVFDEKGTILSKDRYQIDYTTSRLILPSGSKASRIVYRVIAVPFRKPYLHKDVSRIEPDQTQTANPFVYRPQANKEDAFNLGGLNKSGSISRGVSFGNNQDLSVNSNLDLQLSGKLNDDISILAAISDDNIPIQPQGNTQQLQEFDQVYIQLYDDNSKLTAGDFRISRPDSYFMSFNKRLQGGSFETKFITKKEADPADNGMMNAKASVAVSKGKFSRNVIIGTEGNQGPYRLTGAENELFIVIISGTERIYIDGKLMKRGQDYDYVIDYNAAELTFTANQIVTKDKRIIAQFQYTDRNFARSMVHVNNEYEKEKLKLRFNFYNEQDNKNQPLDVDLSSAQKNVLSEIGDSLNQAIFPNFQLDTSGDVESQILYKLLEDTLGGDTVFVYSTNPDSAIYRVGFSLVGQGNGNYIQVNSLANGKVYRWIPPDPVTGLRSGSYSPVRLLATPKLRQMATIGGDYQLSKNSTISFETALTKNDLNTFSEKDRGDDYGYGYMFRMDNALPVGGSKARPLLLNIGGGVDEIDKNFQEIERFRPVEFERDWNLVDRGFGEVIELTENQRQFEAYTGLSRAETGFIKYQFKNLNSGQDYEGINNKLTASFSTNGYFFKYKGSLLNARGDLNTQFIRHSGEVSRVIDWLKVGGGAEMEKSSFFERDSLRRGSFEYRWWETFISNSDTTGNSFRLSYRQREDFNPNFRRESFKRITLGEDVNFEFGLTQNSNHQLRGRVTYRSLKILDSALSEFVPENTVLGKIEYSANFVKQVFTSNTYYEVGSGLEVKKEFSFLEVSPGQGNYYWSEDETDYNNNGIPELNEFEIAQFQDQGNYIRVFTPTNEFVKTFTNGFNQSLFIRPEAAWGMKEGLKKFISVFSDRIAYQVNRKTSREDDLYNPFLSAVKDTGLVSISSSFINSFYINRTNPVYGIELNYRDNKSKTLLTNGFDTRENITQGIRTRWSFSRKFTLETLYEQGKNVSLSEFFMNRNFNISSSKVEPKLSFQSGVKMRISLFFTYLEQRNVEEYGGELSFNRTSGMEFRYNVATKGSFLATLNYINIIYTGEGRSSLAFEMLDGLQPGQNATWGLSYQRNINKNMQLSLNYNGRNSEDARTVHAGGAQVRAFF